MADTNISADGPSDSQAATTQTYTNHQVVALMRNLEEQIRLVCLERDQAREEAFNATRTNTTASNRYHLFQLCSSPPQAQAAGS